MRGLLKLVGKEWRDVRALTAASAVIVVAACLAVRWFLEERYGGAYADFLLMPRHLEAFVPACAALYAALIAADVVGGEVASRRIDLVELLPVGRVRVWAAKALFLLVTSAAFTAWCALVQAAVLAAIDGPPFTQQYVDRAYGSPWALGLVATFAASTLLVSTAGLRGLGAALVGGAAALGLWAGTYEFAGFLGYSRSPYGPYDGSWFEGAPGETIAALWLPPAVLVAAALAYRFGRVHLGRVVRPAAIALGVLVAALAGPGAALAYDALRVVPGQWGTHFTYAWPSPDGRFVALPFRKQRPPDAEKVFVLDVERGILVEPECGNCGVEITPGTWDGVWDADGTLRVVRCGASDVERWRIDPATGGVRAAESLDMEAYSETLRRRMAPWNEATRWRNVENCRTDDGRPTFQVVASDSRSRDRREFRSWAPASIPYPYVRIVYFPEPCILAARMLPDGAERRLLTSREPWKGGRDEVGDLSQDGRALLVRHDGVWKVLDVDTGHAKDLPSCVSRPRWWYVYGGPSRRIVVLHGRRNAPTADLIDLETGARTEAPANDVGEPYATAGGRLVVRHGGTLDLVDRDLKVVRRLWPVAQE